MRSRLSAILSVFFFVFIGLGLVLSAPQANSGSGDIGNGLTHRYPSAPSSNIQPLAVAQFAEEKLLPTTSVRTTFSQTIYLPLVSRPSGRLYGTVSENGVPRRDFTVTLMFCRAHDYVFGSALCIDTQYLYTTTDQAGRYSFNDLPTLILTGPVLMSQTYQVFWYNTDGDPNRLEGWGTRLLDSYTSGDIIDIGNFDVSGVRLVSPESNYVVVNWPITFRWTRRATMPSDSYRPCIIWHGSWETWPIWCDEPLGYVDSFVLDQPLNWAGHCTNTDPEASSYYCAWWVDVYAPDGGRGWSKRFGLVIP